MTEATETAEETPETVEVTWEQLLEILEEKCPSVPTVTEADFQERVLSKEDPNKTVIVDFFARNCGPCHQAADVLEIVAKSGREIVKVDCTSEEGAPVAERFAVSSYPTIVMFQRGQLRSIYTYHRTPEDIEEWIAAFAGPLPAAAK